MSIKILLLVIAIVCFILQALDVQLGKFKIGWAGMACFAGAFIP